MLFSFLRSVFRGYGICFSVLVKKCTKRGGEIYKYIWGVAKTRRKSVNLVNNTDFYSLFSVAYL